MALLGVGHGKIMGAGGRKGNFFCAYFMALDVGLESNRLGTGGAAALRAWLNPDDLDGISPQG
jgi:hypothetical protein